jgi:hypothetical protein
MLIRDLPLELIRELWRLSLKMPSFAFHLQDALVRLEVLEFFARFGRNGAASYETPALQMGPAVRCLDLVPCSV